MKKLIALLLVLLTVVSLFAGCGSSSDEIVLPKQVVPETLENRQNALLEFAWAFYRKNPYIQYDILNFVPASRRILGARTAARMNNTPEMAGPQQYIYQHCMYYNYACVYHAFGHEQMGKWEDCYATALVTGHDLIKPFEVFQYTCTKDESKDLPKMEEMFDLLLPGDLVNYTRHKTDTPHVIIWLGDINGDGEGDMINVGGHPYETETKTDVWDEDGAVFLNASSAAPFKSGEEFFYKKSAYDYFPLLDKISVLRYTDPKHAEDLPLTERSKTRLIYPGLDIWYEVEGGLYGSVPKGEELTYSLTLKNNSDYDHKGISVQLPVPENAEVVKLDGAAAKSKTVKWKVDVAAGETVVHTYTVKATGEVGDVIKSGVGYVHAIPLFEIYTAITSADADAAKVKSALEENKNLTGEAFLAGYLKSMGMDGAIPEVSKIQSALFDRKNLGQTKQLLWKDPADVKEENKALYKMAVPYFFGGQYIATECESLRIKAVEARHLQAGDVLIWLKDNVSDPFVAIHDGEKLLQPVNGGLLPMEQWMLDEFVVHHFFLALRPTQGM